MISRVRCTECGTRFYTATCARVCQNCTGDHDPTKQAQDDAERVRKANSTPKSAKPQAVDPRTGQASNEKATSGPKTETPPTAPSRGSEKKAKGNAKAG